MAQGVDALTHLGQFRFPHLAQLDAVEHAGHQRGAMVGRAGVDRADDALDLRLHRLGRVRIRGDHRQRANALAIQRERLGVRVGDHEAVDAGLGDDAHGGAIFADALVEALVGHVDEREQLAVLQQLGHLLPLRDGEVGTGRVVAARVQQHHGARLQLGQIGQHAVEVHAMGGGIEVGVIDHVEAGRAEHRAMVFPARVADGDGGVRQQLVQQVRADAQRTAAADGLRGGHAAGGQQRRILAEDQLAGGLVVGRQAVDRQVAARFGVIGQLLFDPVHGAEQRDAAALVVIDAHAQVDLDRTAVGVVSLGQAQDRVAWDQFHICKEGHGGTHSDDGRGRVARRRIGGRISQNRPIVTKPRRGRRGCRHVAFRTMACGTPIYRGSRPACSVLPRWPAIVRWPRPCCCRRWRRPRTPPLPPPRSSGCPRSRSRLRAWRRWPISTCPPR